MRFPKKVVDTAVSLYHKGLTLKAVKKAIFEIFNLAISTTSVWKWCQKFGKQTSGVINNLAERLHCDETLIKTFQKGVFYYFWAVKCPVTKAIVGWHLSTKRTLRDAKMLFWEARRKFPVDYLPKAIRTDSMPAYRNAIAKVFNYEVKHEQMKSFKHGNNVIENFFRCKRRFPKFRDTQSAKKYLGRWVCDYNAEKLQILEMIVIGLVKAILRK
jgi:transposase-like protein